MTENKTYRERFWTPYVHCELISRQILLEARFALNRAISAILKKSVLRQNSFERFSHAECADDENNDSCGKVENNEKAAFLVNSLEKFKMNLDNWVKFRTGSFSSLNINI